LRASQPRPSAVEAPTTSRRTKMAGHRIFATPFSAVYPLYVQKATRKGRTKEEVDRVICSLTGYDQAGLQDQIEQRTDFETFFAVAIHREGQPYHQDEQDGCCEEAGTAEDSTTRALALPQSWIPTRRSPRRFRSLRYGQFLLASAMQCGCGTKTNLFIAFVQKTSCFPSR
jgi:hypothetical protein